MIKLPDVTLIALSSVKIPETIHALEICMRNIKFGEVKFVTDKDFYHEKIKHEKCLLMDNVDKYNEYAFIHLGSHVNTSHALIIQYDSWIIRPTLWRDEFLNYSYLGAPWPIVENSYIANDGSRSRVGNGGFSLRDRIVLDSPKKMNWSLRSEQNQKNEDGQICCYYKKEFLELGIKYAPVELAAHFSYENEVEENQFDEIFGFHKNIRWCWQNEVPLK